MFKRLQGAVIISVIYVAIGALDLNVVRQGVQSGAEAVANWTRQEAASSDMASAQAQAEEDVMTQVKGYVHSAATTVLQWVDDIDNTPDEPGITP